ncbi:hypothetical protein V0R50_17335 [Pseudomonas sp. 148P]|uniref:Uncharacterized protein n=1 Tax=Pseudomonas ulcerans TaxID=3115852 RepID=A0ABU7HU12_9PSED|nr:MULTISPECIES: hypothetical protein [unclassified Pseudomonas]MEE1925268.1 hypothetical protein [Pseudomonas sp. 147P]MEE1934994.1 hypothetical protein [Pseudomonas sp. 148P]
MDVDGYTMWVTGGSLVLVAPQVSELECRNVLLTLRDAQAWADGQMASRFAQHRRWYRAYRGALGRRGWRVTHSCQSVETAGGRTLLAPTQPLLLWLGSLHAELGDVLELGIEALTMNPQGFEQLSRHAVRGFRGATQVVLELGVLRPGSQLSLCSIALETTTTLGADWLTAPLSGTSLRGDLYFQGLMAEPAPELRDVGRNDFQRLVRVGHTLH